MNGLARRTKLGIVAGALALAGGLAPPGASATTISSAGPLENIFLQDNLQCQVDYAGDASFSFYYPTSEAGDCATYAYTGGTVYGPGTTGREVPGGGNYPRGDYQTISQDSAPTGSGDPGDPYAVETHVQLGTSNINLIETDSYVVGDQFYSTSVEVKNLIDTSARAARDLSTGSIDPTTAHVVLYHTGDCYLQDNDDGYGYYDSSTGGIYCSATANNNPQARILGFVPASPGISSYFEGDFQAAFESIDADGYDNTCDCNSPEDNGAGLSWGLDVPLGGSQTISFKTALSPEGTTPASADVSVDKSDSADPVTVGDTFTYTLAVKNDGPDSATGVSVSDPLPSQVTFVSASSGCTNSSGTVTCTIGDLDKDGTASPTITVQAMTSGTASNTATVSAISSDPTPRNNSDTETTQINPPPPPPSGDGCTIKGTNGPDNLMGTKKADKICGYGGNDTINGLGGNDTIAGGDGNDTIDAGEGNDTVNGGKGDDTLRGGPGSDRIEGFDGNDTIYGGDLNDNLFGQNGNDKLFGEAGNDKLTGGPNTDQCDQGTGKGSRASCES